MDQFELDPDIAVGRRSPQESGRVVFHATDVLSNQFFFINDPSTYQAKSLIARIDCQEPTSVALHVQAQNNSSGGGYDADFCAQQSNFTTDNSNSPGVVLIVEWGDLTGNHRVFADARSGVYQLPAVTFAQVFALAWNPTNTTLFGQEISVTATLNRAIVPLPKLLTFTANRIMLAADTSSILVPPYAQAVDVWAGTAVFGPGAPVINVNGPAMRRDYTSGLFYPPWGPVSVAGDFINSQVLGVEMESGSARVYVQFYLEL